MNFKNWFENFDSEVQELKDLVFEFAKEKNMPAPTTYLDSGSDAVVFNTNDNGVVARITKNKEKEDLNNCEKLISNPKIQQTGAVVRVLNHSNYDNHLITYKEKINTNWEFFIRIKNPENYREILGDLLNLSGDFHFNDKFEMSKKIKNLTKYKETKQIAILISRMPHLAKDLHEGNLGINKDENIVIIDC